MSETLAGTSIHLTGVTNVKSWLGLSEQLLGFDKWNVCRV
jgi:hypothetical protein